MTDLSRPTAITDIEIASIDVAPGRRRLDPDWVDALAELIAKDGQKTPIEVLATGGRFRLVFGGHRLGALKKLGWFTIQADVKTTQQFASDSAIKLSEIMENLARRELSVLDRAFDITAWREIYEAANGAVKRGRPSKLGQVDPISDDGDERFADSFSEAARKALGVDRNAIKRAVRIASIAASVRERIALHAIADNQSELLLLAAEPAERQAHIAKLLTAPDEFAAASVAEAIAIIDRLPKPVAEPRWHKVAQSFSLLKPADQGRFFELHEAAIQLWLKGRSTR